MPEFLASISKNNAQKIGMTIIPIWEDNTFAVDKAIVFYNVFLK
jgi:hypothetical protein